MKTIKAITSFNEDKLAALGAYAVNELSQANAHQTNLLATSFVLWELDVDGLFVGYAGVACESFVGDKVFWCLLGAFPTKTTIKAYKEFSKLLHAHYPLVVTYVECGWEHGDRFARFCGFIPTEQTVVLAGNQYMKYKRKM